MATTKIDSTGVTFPDGTLQSTSSSNPTPNVQTFNSTGVWTKPSGTYTYAVIQVWGAGGGGAFGGGGSATGGGGGGYSQMTVPLTNLASSATASVGTGGSGGYNAGGGGNSSFPLAVAFAGRSAVIAYGGAGGNYYSPAGDGGSSWGFTWYLSSPKQPYAAQGENGGSGSSYSTGNTLYSGPGGVGYLATPGVATLGGGYGGAYASPGGAPGGGGGMTNGSSAYNPGANGKIVVTCY